MSMFPEFEAKYSCRVVATHSFSAGLSGAVTGIDCDDGASYVVKAYPSGGGEIERLTREWQGLSALSEAGLSVPRPVFLCTEAERPYFAMEKVPGKTFTDAYASWTEEQRGTMATKLLDLADDLHRQNLARRLSPHSSNTADFIRAELADCRSILAGLGLPELEKVLSWLLQRAATLGPRPSCIIHRDLHPWNILVDASFRLWLIDIQWGIGDPRFDLAWMLNTLDFAGKDELSSRLKRLLTARTASLCDGLPFFRTLARFRWLLETLDSIRGQDWLKAEEPSQRAMVSGMLGKVLKSLKEDLGVDLELELFNEL